MTLNRIFQVSHVLLLTASLTTALPFLLKPPVSIAQTTKASSNAPAQETISPQRARIDVSGKRGTPTRRFGGGSRVGGELVVQSGQLRPSSCVTGPQAIAMIAPADNVTLTTSAQPTLMLWVNESAQTKDLELALRQGPEGEGAEIYRKLVTLPGEAGLVTLDLATLNDAPSLTQGEDYYVYLSLVCDASDRSKDMVAEGRLSYVHDESSLSGEGGQSASTPDQQGLTLIPSVEQSLELGLWHDAMVQLNDLRRNGQTQVIRQQAQQRWQQQLDADDELYVLADQTENVVAPIAITDAPELIPF